MLAIFAVLAMAPSALSARSPATPQSAGDTIKDVDTNDHIVTLKGTVLTSAGRARAGAVARQTEGVRRVVNNLTIGSKSRG